ncbi:MAG: hypothetical protein AAF413_00835 [Patescibacteria group bacterium]
MKLRAPIENELYPPPVSLGKLGPLVFTSFEKLLTGGGYRGSHPKSISEFGRVMAAEPNAVKAILSWADLSEVGLEFIYARHEIIGRHVSPDAWHTDPFAYSVLGASSLTTEYGFSAQPIPYTEVQELYDPYENEYRMARRIIAEYGTNFIRFKPRTYELMGTRRWTLHRFKGNYTDRNTGRILLRAGFNPLEYIECLARAAGQDRSGVQS